MSIKPTKKRFRLEILGSSVSGLLLLLIIFMLVIAAVSLYKQEASSASVFISIAALVMSAISAFSAFQTIREMQIDRRLRSEPYVVASMEIAPMESSVYVFRLHNFGQGPAYSIELSFDPMPIDALGRRFGELPLFQKPIPLLVQGGEIKTVFSTVSVLKKNEIPRVFDVNVKYIDQNYREYSNQFHIDCNPQGFLAVAGNSNSVESQMKQLVGKISDISRSLSKIEKDLRRYQEPEEDN